MSWEEMITRSERWDPSTIFAYLSVLIEEQVRPFLKFGFDYFYFD